MSAIALLTDMLRIRRLEEKSAELYGAGRIRGFLHLYIGEEAVAAGCMRALARRRLGAAVAPREIAFAETLPHTRSGKIMRRLLRARKLGLPEGDLSTLEDER